MINSFSKFFKQNLGCEDKYTTQIDARLHEMQKEGYEIVDVKFKSLMNQGVFGEMEGFHTLIIHR